MAELQPRKPYVEQVAYSISESTIRIGNETIKINLTFPPTAIEPLFSGGCWAGSVVWPAALFLSNYLEQEKVCAIRPTVLELGSGMGVPGIVAGYLGAKKVFLTEQPPLDELLAENIRALFPNEETRPYEVMTLDWNKCRMVNNGEPIDLILISDCIFTGLYGDSWKLLAQVVNVYLHGSNARCLNSVERRCADDGVDEFNTYCLEKFNIKSRLLCSVAENRIELYELTRI